MDKDLNPDIPDSNNRNNSLNNEFEILNSNNEFEVVINKELIFEINKYIYKLINIIKIKRGKK